jgi:hypothetical protein
MSERPMEMRVYAADLLTTGLYIKRIEILIA